MNAILLLHMPNLGILGECESQVDGRETLGDIEKMVAIEVAEVGREVISVQREGEGELVRAVHAHRSMNVGALVNPGAPVIAGWSLRDAPTAYDPPWIEVHPTNRWARERFRHESVLAPLASGVVVGLGAFGHRSAARALVRLSRAVAGHS